MIPAKIATEGDGRGLSIAVIDSGINFDHPHLAMTGQSFEVFWDSNECLDVRGGGIRDSFGHGTCCAALIHYLAPKARLLAVKVTGEGTTTDADRLAFGIRLAAKKSAGIVCVPMATQTRVRHGLDSAVAHCLAEGCLVIGADPGIEDAFPAHCPGALPVRVFDGVDVALDDGQVCADGFARPFAGALKNFYGPSLAAARVAAACARFAQISNFRGTELMSGFINLLRML